MFKFGMFILKTVVFLVLGLFAVSAVMHRDPLQSLLFAVALAVGLTPEFLPMITSVTLAQGRCAHGAVVFWLYRRGDRLLSLLVELVKRQVVRRSFA